MAGGIAARAKGMFRCPSCEKKFRRELRLPVQAPQRITWFEKIAVLWTLLELECRRCKHLWTVNLVVFAFTLFPFLIACGLLVMPAGICGDRWRWYKPVLQAVAVVLALPFLLVSVLTAALALGWKYLIYLASFTRRCPECGGHRWRIANLGVADFWAAMR
jgi:hypothetical protein